MKINSDRNFIHALSWLCRYLLVVVVILVFSSQSIYAAACDEFNCDSKKNDKDAYLSCISDKKSCLEKKLAETNSQKNTLSNAIALIVGKIKLQEVKIAQTETEIEALQTEIGSLSNHISVLNASLDQLTAMLLDRVREQYKTSRMKATTPLLLSSGKVLGVTRYLSETGNKTATVMHLAESQRLQFDDQKAKKEKVQAQLESKQALLVNQKRDLTSEQGAQQKLLTQTKNDEATYQKQLEAVLSEFQAIQAIIAGSGSESKIRDVNAGEKIATVIAGKSCNSAGEHLHFMITKSGATQNPFSYLKNIDHTNCSGSSCGSSDGDSFNPSGNWDWPISGPITMNQGYGTTWAVRHTWVSRIYSFHNGIDIEGGNEVKAVESGALYRGSFSGSAGCALRYVKVVHKNDNLVSWYLHVNY